MELFRQRYCQPGTPLASVGQGMRCPDFEEWRLMVDISEIQRGAEGASEGGRGSAGVLAELQECGLICCPEDHE
eukprot:2571069-Pyramimonas_sp.AAC.1